MKMRNMQFHQIFSYLIVLEATELVSRRKRFFIHLKKTSKIWN